MSVELGLEAISIASKLGAVYSDIRIGEVRDRAIATRNGAVTTAQLVRSVGFGVRVLLNGAWGFAGSTEITKKEIGSVTEKAAKIAKASASVRKRSVELVTSNVSKASYRTPMNKDPFDVSVEDITNVLVTADRNMAGQSDLIKSTSASFHAYKDKKLLLTSEGAEIDQEITWCGGIMECIALRSGESQIRRYPHRRGRYNTSGYENFLALNFPAEAERCGKEAVQLLDAERLSEQKTDLVIKNDQIVIQVHESSGHPTELDRVLGTEADSAGTSFLTPDGLGKFRYGSEVVNIVADATVPKGLGTFGYDDDGIPAKRTDLVKEGIHVGYTSSRETAAELGLKTSSGNARAQFAYSLPMVRMTNINLLPGDWKSDEIVEDTKKGVLMVCNKSHSIDDRRLNFQFGTEIGWEIKNGSLERMVKNCIYTGITPEFWGSCDAISNDDWHMDGTTGCGKGSPGQSTYVGHGVSTARFRTTRVWSE